MARVYKLLSHQNDSKRCTHQNLTTISRAKGYHLFLRSTLTELDYKLSCWPVATWRMQCHMKTPYADSKSTNIHWSISDVSEVKQQRPCGRHQTWYSLYAEWALQWPQCSATWKSETRSNGHISAGQYHQIPEKMFLLIDEIWWNIPLSLWTWCFQKDFSRIQDCIQCIPWISFNPDPRAF